MNMDYRNSARRYLESSNSNLAKNLDASLKYAALDLRMAMEAITYDRALGYKDEFPPEEYETWQVKKVMAILLEIDPSADQDSSLFVGVEEEYGVPAKEMTPLGAEKVLNLKLLKSHYDALGSYLHVQTIKSLRSGKLIDYKKMRSRCEEISTFLAEVLSSPVFNLTFGAFAAIDCSGCGKTIRKRSPVGAKKVLADCHECEASYTLAEEGDKVKWTPNLHELECGNPDCSFRVKLWHREVALGRKWVCAECGGDNIFSLGTIYQCPSDKNDS